MLEYYYRFVCVIELSICAIVVQRLIDGTAFTERYRIRHVHIVANIIGHGHDRDVSNLRGGRDLVDCGMFPLVKVTVAAEARAATLK